MTRRLLVLLLLAVAPLAAQPKPVKRPPPTCIVRPEGMKCGSGVFVPYRSAARPQSGYTIVWGREQRVAALVPKPKPKPVARPVPGCTYDIPFGCPWGYAGVDA